MDLDEYRKAAYIVECTIDVHWCITFMEPDRGKLRFV